MSESEASALDHWYVLRRVYRHTKARRAHPQESVMVCTITIGRGSQELKSQELL